MTNELAQVVRTGCSQSGKAKMDRSTGVPTIGIQRLIAGIPKMADLIFKFSES
jgi:hypothetical protein